MVYFSCAHVSTLKKTLKRLEMSEAFVNIDCQDDFAGDFRGWQKKWARLKFVLTRGASGPLWDHYSPEKEPLFRHQ